MKDDHSQDYFVVKVHDNKNKKHYYAICRVIITVDAGNDLGDGSLMKEYLDKKFQSAELESLKAQGWCFDEVGMRAYTGGTIDSAGGR